MTPTLVILSPILQGRTGRKNPTAPEALALSSPFFPAPANPAAYAKGTSHHRGGSLLRVDPQTLRIWRVTGHHHDLPFVKMGSGGTGGRVYYRRSDLEAFITRHLFRNTAQADVIPAPWRHSRASGRHPRESGDPAVVRLVRDAPCALCSLSPWERAG